MQKMVWDNDKGRMVKPEKGKGGKEIERVGIPVELYNALRDFAKEDGYHLSGIRLITQKDAKGKTIKKNGKPVYVMDGEKPKAEIIIESRGKTNSAVSDYVQVAIRRLIALRRAREAQLKPQGQPQSTTE